MILIIIGFDRYKHTKTKTKIPWEMEVAPPHKLIALFSAHTACKHCLHCLYCLHYLQRFQCLHCFHRLFCWDCWDCRRRKTNKFNIYWFRVNNNTSKRQTKEISNRYPSNIWQPNHNVLNRENCKTPGKRWEKLTKRFSHIMLRLSYRKGRTDWSWWMISWRQKGLCLSGQRSTNKLRQTQTYNLTNVQ